MIHGCQWAIVCSVCLPVPRIGLRAGNRCRPHCFFFAPHHHNQQHLQGGCRIRRALVGRSKDPCSGHDTPISLFGVIDARRAGHMMSIPERKKALLRSLSTA